jgi:hypothetical protein
VLPCVGLIVMACGPTSSAQASPARSASPTFQSTPSAAPSPDGVTASVTCSGGAGTRLTVVAGAFVYDVADTLHPRLVCRSANTVIHLLAGNAIAYTAVADGHIVIVRRDVTTGAESRIAQLRQEPYPYYYGVVGWTWDGSLEVFSTATAPNADGRSVVSVHLWSNGADHVLHSLDAGPGGIESRWGPRGVLAFSPDRAYLAISDFPFYVYGERVRIISLADLSEKFVTGGSATGGSWLANDRFVWATAACR